MAGPPSSASSRRGRLRQASTAEELAFGRFRLVDRIGAGGMAEVWRAHDERLGRDVALKRLHPFLVLDDSDRDRLLAEARAVASLAHPNTVTLYDVVSDASGTGLVLELVDGESLADRLGRGERASTAVALGIVDDVAAALGAAHALGIVHRDVKPGTILIDRSGRARLVGFGIAQAIDDAGDEQHPGTILGTAPYIAPEQLRGEPVSPATDAYALAVVAYDLLAGRRPFEATAPVALADAQIRGPRPIEGLPPSVDEVFRHALSLDPRARPAPGALAVALRASVESAGESEHVASTAGSGPIVGVGAAPAGEAAPATTTFPPATARKLARRARHPDAPSLPARALAGAALVLALAVLAGGWLVGTSTSSPTAADPGGRTGALAAETPRPFSTATPAPTRTRSPEATAKPTPRPTAPAAVAAATRMGGGRGGAHHGGGNTGGRDGGGHDGGGHGHGKGHDKHDGQHGNG
jgi:serine/threonine-protein kinase